MLMSSQAMDPCVTMKTALSAEITNAPNEVFWYLVECRADYVCHCNYYIYAGMFPVFLAVLMRGRLHQKQLLK